ncbi:ABC transporter permease [Paenibacillus massiliensis]|uniref:ABC transporter permease n=1 Tax=Paenibacillus massiliensis TaxID=225917 RepID=UPI0003733801|nr:sugar ABC transporter permease [Paenibacillus massiliensis]
MNQVSVPTKRLKPLSQKESLSKSILKNGALYFMILPGFLYFVIFKYLPMFGLVIAFQDYKPYQGILGSRWVGLAHFERLFAEPMFLNILVNTLVLFFMNLIFFFPVPILLALMLNEVRQQAFKRVIQTMVYIPHFMSWVIIVSISFVMLSMDRGLVNELLVAGGFEKVNFLLNPDWFRPTYILQIIWREAGWGTIIYLAAMASIDPQLYEASRMDGAGRFRQIWHITLPSIRSVIVILLLLKIGDVLEVGFEHIFLLLNAMNREVGEVFDTYVYLAGLQQGQFSYSAAVGFFKSFVGLALVVTANWLSKKFGEEGIY